MHITNDYDSFTNCTDNENDNNIIVKYLLLSILSGVIILSLISLIIWTTLKLLSTNK